MRCTCGNCKDHSFHLSWILAREHRREITRANENWILPRRLRTARRNDPSIHCRDIPGNCNRVTIKENLETRCTKRKYNRRHAEAGAFPRFVSQTLDHEARLLEPPLHAARRPLSGMRTRWSGWLCRRWNARRLIRANGRSRCVRSGSRISPRPVVPRARRQHQEAGKQ